MSHVASSASREDTFWNRIELVQGNIVEQDTDAIVNAANSSLKPGGGVARAIHRAAGPELQRACDAIGGCPPGSARITLGYALRAKYIIHAVGPIYRANPEDAELLASCYRQAMKLAIAHGVRTIAFPSISTSAFRFPIEDAAPIALATVATNLVAEPHLSLVRFVLFDDLTLNAYQVALHLLRVAAQ